MLAAFRDCFLADGDLHDNRNLDWAVPLMNIVIANAVAILDTGQEVVPFPSRWDSGLPKGMSALFRWYPYELATLSALLKRESDEGRMPKAKVTLLDGNVEGWNGDRYIEEIAKLRPDVLICELSALTYPTMTRVMAGVRACMYKDFDKEIEAILCGPMGGVAPKEDDWTRRWNVSVKGEYELEVLEHLGGTVPPEAYTDAGLINLDWLPWPEDEDVNRFAYYEINHYAPGMVQVYPTRGCPLSCTFCVVPTYYGGHGKSHKSHRCRQVEDVCNEIEWLAYLGQKTGQHFGGCYFNEEAHNANVEWLVQLCDALKGRGLNKYQYDAMCGYWPMTKELVELMASAGYKQIRFGVESTSQQVGKSIGKTIHLEKMEAFMGWCKAVGIKCYGTFQIGAPGSTEATDRQTLADRDRWYRQGLMQKWQVSTSTPQPGTPFYEQCKAEGWLVTEDINHFDGVNAVVSYPTYSAERIYAVRMAA